MVSDDTDVIASRQQDKTDTGLPQIGVVVTADVRVVHYRSSESLGNSDNTKCTVITSLSAIINDSLNRSLRSQLFDKCKESIAGSAQTPVLSNEACDHPVVRRSKKNTQLNYSVNINDFTISKRAQIDRTVILPYLGCTRGFESFQSYNAQVLVKSSKSWETVQKSNKAKNVKPFRSLTFNNRASLNNTSSEVNFLDSQDLVKHKKLVQCLGEYEPPNTSFDISKEAVPKKAVRSFYLMKTPTSGSKPFSSCKNTGKKDCTGGQQYNNSNLPAATYLYKNDLPKNITGFEREIFLPSATLSCKATRNVSILHRPKTRDKSTSTTSLNKQIDGQDLDKSIQGLLMPYIENGRDFPSEIVLKLVPKAEALKNSLNDNSNKTSRSTNSSEVNLLAPKLNSVTKHKKKNKGTKYSFWNCFTKKKNADDNFSDSNTSDKEVYFPSIVEVHNKHKKFSEHPNSDEENSVSSFYSVDKKNKQK